MEKKFKKEEFYFYSAFGKQKFKKYPLEVPFLFLWNGIMCLLWFPISLLFIFIDYIAEFILTNKKERKRR